MNICVQLCVQLCREHMCAEVRGVPAHGHACRHAHRHVCGNVERNLLMEVYLWNCIYGNIFMDAGFEIQAW